MCFRLNVQEQRETLLDYLIPKVRDRPAIWDLRLQNFRRGGNEYRNAFVEITEEMEDIVGPRYNGT